MSSDCHEVATKLSKSFIKKLNTFIWKKPCNREKNCKNAMQWKKLAIGVLTSDWQRCIRVQTLHDPWTHVRGHLHSGRGALHTGRGHLLRLCFAFPVTTAGHKSCTSFLFRSCTGIGDLETICEILEICWPNKQPRRGFGRSTPNFFVTHQILLFLERQKILCLIY